MPLSTQGIAARWLLFTTALITFPHLAKANDNLAGFDWMNETQLLAMFEYENRTEKNLMEAEVESLSAGKTDSETVGETIDWLNETQLMAMFVYGNSTEENVMDFEVDESFESPTVRESDDETILEAFGKPVSETPGESIVRTVGETVAETVGETVGEIFGETVAETVGETVVETVVEIVDETIVMKSNGSSNMDFPFEKLRQHRYYSRIIFMIILLHVSVVGVCITIYSLVYCKMKTLKRLQRARAQRCLRLMNLQSQHVPNSRECPCSGCTIARDMLQGLILQQLHEMVEC